MVNRLLNIPRHLGKKLLCSFWVIVAVFVFTGITVVISHSNSWIFSMQPYQTIIVKSGAKIESFLNKNQSGLIADVSYLHNSLYNRNLHNQNKDQVLKHTTFLVYIFFYNQYLTNFLMQVKVVGYVSNMFIMVWWFLVEHIVKTIIYQVMPFIVAITAVVFFVFVIFALVAWYVIKKIIEPLNILRDGVAMLAQGKLEHLIKIPASANNRIHLLAEDFNEMSIALFESQQSLADAAEENALLYREEQRRVGEFALVNQINHTVMASLDVETTIDAVLRNLKGLLDYKSAEINIWDEERKLLKAYSVGDTTYTTSIDNHYTLDEGYTGWIARYREPLFITNVKGFLRVKPKLLLEEFPFQAYIGLPLTVGQNFLGTIELAHEKLNKYNLADLNSLQILAGQAAVAIRHAQIFQEGQKHAQAQEQLASIASVASSTLNLDELLNQIMTKTIKAIGAQIGAVLLLNKEETELYPHPASIIGLNPNTVKSFTIATDTLQFKQSVFFTGKPFITNKAISDKRILPFYQAFSKEFNIQTALVVSLKTADKAVGEIYVLNKPEPFTQRDVTFLSSVAVHFASAIQNTKLFQTTQRNLNQLSTLYQSTADLSSSLSVEEVLTNLVTRMVSSLPADECAISEYDAATGRIERIKEYLLSSQESEAQQSYSISDYPLAKKVLQIHTPLVVNLNDPDINEDAKQILEKFNHTVLLMLPLVARNKPIGLVELYTKHDISYKSEEIDLAQAMANQAAIALQNAQLFKETDQQLTLRVKELSGLQNVGRELNSTLDLNTIIQLVIKEAVRATGADFGNIDLYNQKTKELKTYVQVGWLNKRIENLPITINQAKIMRRVLDSNTPEILDDISQDAAYISAPLPTRSEMIVPIEYGGVVEGGISLKSIKRAGFKPAQLHYVQALADQAAIAIRNARAFEDQTQERRQATTRVNQLAKLSEINRAFRANRPLAFILEEIAFAIQETVEFNIALLGIVMYNQLYYITGAGIPIAKLTEAREKPLQIKFLQKMMQPEFKISESFFIPVEKKELLSQNVNAFFIHDAFIGTEGKNENTWHTGDFLFTPLKDSEGDLIGLLSVDAPSSNQRPSAQEVTVLELFANQAASAIENANLFQELKRQTTQLRLSSQISARISRILNPNELMGEVVNLIAEAFNYYYVQIYQVDEQRLNSLVVKNTAGTANLTSKPSNSELYLPIDAQSIVGWVAKQRQPLLVNNFQKDARFANSPCLPNTLSQMAVPVKWHQNLEGVLSVQHDKLNAFTKEDLDNLQTLADQLSVAIHNAYLFDEALQREQLSSALGNTGLVLNATLNPDAIFDVICEEAITVFKLDGAYLWMVHNQHIKATAAAGKNKQKFIGKILPLFDETILATRIIKNKQAEFLNGINFSENKIYLPLVNELDAHSVIGAPLIVGDQVMGAIMMVDCKDNNRFDNQHRSSATLLANQAAIAIENARLFKTEQRRVVELNILNQTGQSLSTTRDIQSLVNVIDYQVSQLLSAKNLFVALYNAETNMISFPLAKGGEKKEWLPRIAKNGLVEHIIKTKASLLLTEDIKPKLKALGIKPVGKMIKSWLGVPMVSGETVLGVVALQDYDNANAYSINDQNLLLTIATQAAIALQNLYLLQDTQTYAQEMRHLYELGVSVSQEFDINQIAQTVVKEALTLTNMQIGVIFVWDDETKKYMIEAVNKITSQPQKLVFEPTQSSDLVNEVIKANQHLIIDNQMLNSPIANTLEMFGASCVIAIPIKIGEDKIGALFVYGLKPHSFSQRSINLLQFITNQAAVTIKNAQLVHRLNKFTEELEFRVKDRTEKLRQERDRVDTLYTMARELSSSLDLDRVLNEALGLINRSIKITQGSILLIDDATGKLIYRAAIGRVPLLPKGGKPTRYKSGVGLAGQALEARRPLIVNNILEDKHWIPSDKPVRYHSALVVPLVTGYEILGVLMLFHTEIGYFTEDHLRLVTAVAPIIATAINNAGLYNLISDQVERLGVLLNTVRFEARKNEAIVEGIADGVLLLDGDYNIQLINPAAADILGQNRKSLQNQRLDRILSVKPENVQEQFVHDLYHLIINQPSYSTTTEDGKPLVHRVEIEKKVVLVTLSIVTLSSNAPASTLVVLRDISREAELDNIKNEFISTVSHELRTPMTSIKGYTDLLVSDKVGSLTAMQRKFIQVIKSNADRLTALVNDILDISRIDTGRIKLDLQFIELKPLVNNIVISFEHELKEKELVLITNIPKDLPLVFADPNRITQILVNLIGNAVKYTRVKDSITVSLKQVEQFVQTDVSDTGLGLAEEDQTHIFDRFFRAERDASSLVDGTGLGLPIAKMFVEMMGGKIWFKSKLNIGSTFSFTLPLQDQRIEEDKVVDFFSNNRTILIVNNNKNILKQLKQQLEPEGYTIITTRQGDEVLNLVKKYQPVLITLDIMLDDINGFDILEELKEDPLTKDIPVVIMPILTNVDNKNVALGAIGYIVKPFNKSQVLSTIKNSIANLDKNGDKKPINKILIVDDDKNTVSWLSKQLLEIGFKVETAYNGKQALLVIKNQKPDLILLDLIMPDINGFQVIQQLNLQDTALNIPVIVITDSAINKKNNKVKILASKAGHLLTKPFSLEQLAFEIKQFAT